jgi:membrane peptidoglycan carboxypeptidase
MLAGLVNGPTLDDPLTNPVNGMAREQHVISRLLADDVLTPAQASQARAVSLRAMTAHRGQGCEARGAGVTPGERGSGDNPGESD